MIGYDTQVTLKHAGKMTDQIQIVAGQKLALYDDSLATLRTSNNDTRCLREVGCSQMTMISPTSDRYSIQIKALFINIISIISIIPT